MLKLSTMAIFEKNRIDTNSAWFILLEIALPGGETIRVCNNNETITWGGHDWISFPFELDEVSESSKNEIPSINVKISNVSQELQRYMELSNGGSNFPVILRAVNTRALDGAAEIELNYSCLSCKYDATWLTFALGGNQTITKRVPENRYLKDWCHYQYTDIQCGVNRAGAIFASYPKCGKTLADCRLRLNSPRYGGCPSISFGGFHE